MSTNSPLGSGPGMEALAPLVLGMASWAPVPGRKPRFTLKPPSHLTGTCPSKGPPCLQLAFQLSRKARDGHRAMGGRAKPGPALTTMLTRQEHAPHSGLGQPDPGSSEHSISLSPWHRPPSSHSPSCAVWAPTAPSRAVTDTRHMVGDRVLQSFPPVQAYVQASTRHSVGDRVLLSFPPAWEAMQESWRVREGSQEVAAPAP